MPDSDNKIILIVDDVPENIDVLRGILKHKYQIKVATDGKKALSIAQGKSKPDLILLDIMMSGMDGYEVCRQLKSKETTSEIPVIFVTAKGEARDESHGFDLGAVDYITKPVNPSLVLSRVNTHLSLYTKQKELQEIHKLTRDSIEYAALIQGALIPENKIFKQYFKDYFIIWHPKDVVGGDIYV